MFTHTYQATHPDMMEGVDNETLRDRYLVTGIFNADGISLNYSHNERLVVGGAAPVAKPVRLPDQEAPVKGAPFLERRELGVVNVGEGAGKITVDGKSFDMDARDGLYMPMGSIEVVFDSNDMA
jgi:4-deoxy-L-threo-5-hexosulose-uronate ketol-isomerase